jgi:hypothetical protein
MDNNLIISIIAIISSVFGVVCGILNHKRCRSKCFSEKEIILSLDVENTTPQTKELKIKIPKLPDSPSFSSDEDTRVKVPEILDDVKYA